ncbi:MAG: hypothetical protein IJU64_07315 [Bacilli bacterium]|nr:hypothetical protein [Bacilli bacterium]
MGRIYESIRKDIETLRRIDQALRNNELLSMDQVFETSLAMQKINYVITYAESEQPELLADTVFFPQGDMQHFNIPNNFEELVDSWEESLGEERTDHAVDHLSRQEEAETYVPEITPHNSRAYYEYVHDTVHQIAQISSLGHFGITNEGVAQMARSAAQDFVTVAKQQNFVYDPRNDSEVYDFLRDPVRTVVNENRERMRLDDADFRTAFFEEQRALTEEQFQNAPHPNPEEELQNYMPVAKALQPLAQSKWDTKSLADALKKSVQNYLTRPHKNENDPNLGAFLSEARDHFETIFLNHAVDLNADANGEFLKNFLKNPVDAMEKHFTELSSMQSNRANVVYRNHVRSIHEAAADYQQARVGKLDRYAQLLDTRKARTENLLQEFDPAFNPANFKRRFQGNAFERFLGRTSQEWNDLSDHIDRWKNDGAQRDYDQAADLAKKYLDHKFPGVDPKNITPEMVRGLRGAGKERSAFCLNLLQSHDQADAEMNQAIYDQANARFDENENRLHRAQIFQDQVARDLNDENEIQPNHEQEEVNENLIVQNENNLEA